MLYSFIGFIKKYAYAFPLRILLIIWLASVYRLGVQTSLCQLGDERIAGLTQHC
jgi:hypothetical protein